LGRAIDFKEPCNLILFAIFETYPYDRSIEGRKRDRARQRYIKTRRANGDCCWTLTVSNVMA